MAHPKLPIDVPQELAGARFGDARLSARVVTVEEALVANPDASFPQAMANTAALEALYRFLSNPRVTPAAILKPHQDATVGRAAMVGEVIAIHDSTEISPEGCSEGAGFYRLSNKHFGFLAHVSLIVSVEGACPLGVGRLSFVDRQEEPKVKTKKKPWGKRWADPNKESLRWARGAHEVQESLGKACSVTHVMDREADSYEIFHSLAMEGLNFVIRLTHDRRVKDDGAHNISDVLDAQPSVLEREVHLSSRKKSTLKDKNRKHPPRETRVARLAIRAASVTIRRPTQLPASLPETQRVNVVRVDELDTPEDANPVVWNLVTMLPISTPEEVARVVDLYRGRWQIEEFFKALKTGCAFNERPLESFKTASTALALFMPLAVQLLQLRYLSRQQPTAPASTLFSPEVIAVIRQHAASDRRLPPRASVRHVMLAIAGFGGHLKSNGDPGWQVLGRGYLRLCQYVELSTLVSALRTSTTSSPRASQRM